MTERPTPLVDKWESVRVVIPEGRVATVPAAFARTLERDRAELMEALRALIAWDEGGEGSWDMAGPHMRPFDKARALLARLEK